jgi:hypothetical protein
MTEWGQTKSFLGIDLGRTGGVAREEFVCQSCGAQFRIEDGRSRLMVGLLGTLVGGLFALLGGVVALAGVEERNLALLAGALGVSATLACLACYATWWWSEPWRIQRNNPIVAAPVPEVRFFPDPQPRRRCLCGAAAPCVRVVESVGRGVSQGTAFTHRCTTCSREFTIENARSLVVLCIGCVVFVGLGVVGLTHSSGQGAFAWTLSSLSTLFGALGAVAFVAQLRDRVRHPVVRYARDERRQGLD